MIYWSLSLVAVPAILYLVCRRPAKTVFWGGMQFLEDAVRKIRFRTRMLEMVCVMLQTAVVFLCVTAVILPRMDWFSGFAAGGKGGSEEAIFILDNSASMTGGAGVSPAGAAENLLSRYPEKAKIVVMPMISPGEISVKDRQEAFYAVRRTEVTDAAISPEDFLTAFAKCPASEVFIFSDFLWDWPEAERERFRQMLSGSRVTCVKTAVNRGENVGITELAPARFPVILGENISLEVTLRNYGKTAARRQVTLYENAEKPISRQWTDIPPEAEVTLAFPYPVTRTGAFFFEARLTEADGFPPDDVRRVTFRAEDRWRVLIVEPWRKESEKEGAAAFAGTYLGSALEGIAAVRARNRVSSEGFSQEYLHLEKIPDGRLAQTFLPDYHAVMLCGISRFSPEEADVLRDYVRAGGAIFVFPDETTEAADYEKLADFLPGVPAEFVRLSSEETAHVDVLEYRHPAVKFFAEQENTGLDAIPVSRYWRLRPAEDAQTVLGLTGGDPFLLSRDVFGGRILMFSAPADMRGTPLPLSGVFVPLMDRLMQFSAIPRGESRNFIADEERPHAGIFADYVVNSDPAEARSLALSPDECLNAFFAGIPHRVETPETVFARTAQAAKDRVSWFLLAAAFLLLAGEMVLSQSTRR